MMYYKEVRSKKERRAIYKILRSHGISVANAQRLRDWSFGHISQFLLNFYDAKKVDEIMSEIKREVRR